MSPSGIQADSPLQRTWMIFWRNGSSASNASQVCGASLRSQRASKANGPAVMVRSLMVVLWSGVSRRPCAPGATRPSENTVRPRSSVRDDAGAQGAARRTGWRGGGRGARPSACSPRRSTSTRSASAPGSRRPLRSPKRRAGAPVTRSASGAGGRPRRRPSCEQQRERRLGAGDPAPGAREAALLHRRRARRVVGGDERDPPAAPSSPQSASRSPAGRSGGAHLASVPSRSRSSSVSAR